MMTQRFRLKEAMAYAADCGKRYKACEIADILWPDSTPNCKAHNMSNLINGKTARVDIRWVGILTELLDCTSDMLFGLQPFPNVPNSK